MPIVEQLHISPKELNEEYKPILISTAGGSGGCDLHNITTPHFVKSTMPAVRRREWMEEYNKLGSALEPDHIRSSSIPYKMMSEEELGDPHFAKSTMLAVGRRDDGMVPTEDSSKSTLDKKVEKKDRMMNEDDDYLLDSDDESFGIGARRFARSTIPHARRSDERGRMVLGPSPSLGEKRDRCTLFITEGASALGYPKMNKELLSPLSMNSDMMLLPRAGMLGRKVEKILSDDGSSAEELGKQHDLTTLLAAKEIAESRRDRANYDAGRLCRDAAVDRESRYLYHQAEQDVTKYRNKVEVLEEAIASKK